MYAKIQEQQENRGGGNLLKLCSDSILRCLKLFIFNCNPAGTSGYSKFLHCHPESACHAELVLASQDNRFRNKFEMTVLAQKAAFTLAEILITLGIIGIVAAMTIPTIAANVVGHKYRNQYKKTMSTISQAVRLNKANYDWDFADATAECDARNYFTDASDRKMTACAIFNSNLSAITNHYNNMNVLTNKYGYKFNGKTIGVYTGYDAYIIYQLADGSIFGFGGAAIGRNGGCSLPIGKKAILNYSMQHCGGFIDVNGFSLPNEEIKCSVGKTSRDVDADCIVKNKDLKDVYPIIYHDSTVEPATNAAKYVFLNTK